MKFNIKSKLGFTLIELLVVIGILAVLAAIAIPSVAGLIDRANVSADSTNANEMTNAIERFTSEYELYCQDIASGRAKEGDLDSAQGRVFNVTGADSREDIELLEGAGLSGKQINIDTKYPENIVTLQAVVENYMKTSSTTFTPKQSDCHFYYSPDCGLVVCTETNKSAVTDLNKLVQSGKDAKGKDLGTSTRWIDVTTDVSLSGGENVPSMDGIYEYGTNDADLNHNNIIPEGGTYYVGANSHDGTIVNITEVYTAGDTFPTPSEGDIYVYGDFQYCYEKIYSNGGGEWDSADSWGYPEKGGWGVKAFENGISDTKPILESINNKPIYYLYTIFDYTTPNYPVTVPQSALYLDCDFYNCPTDIPCHLASGTYSGEQVSVYHYNGCGH